MGAIIETMWHVSVVDIEATLRSACHKVFKDSGVSADVRNARAEALLILAEAYGEFSQTHESGLAAFRVQLNDEMKAAEEAAKHRQAYEEGVKLAQEDAARRLAVEEKIRSGELSQEELRAMKPKVLREICQARHLDSSSCVEKEDFVKLIFEAQSYEVL
jgi:hypothetical protein